MRYFVAAVAAVALPASPAFAAGGCLYILRAHREEDVAHAIDHPPAEIVRVARGVPPALRSESGEPRDR